MTLHPIFQNVVEAHGLAPQGAEDAPQVETVAGDVPATKSAVGFTPGRWRSSSMTMDRKEWALLNGKGGIQIVQRGEDVIAAVWCGDDRDEIDRVETLVRNALLQMLSEARTMTLNMDSGVRDKLMDGLQSNFNPDSDVMQDLFTASFYDVKNLADEVVEERRLEAKYPMRAAE